MIDTPEDIKRTAAWIAAHRLDLRTDAGMQIVGLIEAALIAERLRSTYRTEDCGKCGRKRVV